MNDKIYRLRMFAGPNGSGKSTLIKRLEEKFNMGYFLNADDILSNLLKRNYINLIHFNLNITNDELLTFIQKSSLAKKIINKSQLNSIFIDRNILIINKKPDSYLASFISEFIRYNLILLKQTVSFETVMSHPSKIEFLKNAKKEGYRTYLYFVATKSYLINTERIKTRVKKGGHDVPSNKIKTRYFRSLDLLNSAIKLTRRAYIFDNSGAEMKWIAEVTDGKKIEIYSKTIPQWFEKYMLDKM